MLFRSVYTGSKGAPGKTTLTPAYLSYQAGFINQQWGQAAAIAFILFAIIVALTILQRWVLRERGVSRRRMRRNGFVDDGDGRYRAVDASIAMAEIGGTDLRGRSGRDGR